MYTKNLLNFTNGYWEAKFGDYSRGIENLKLALSIFENLEKPIIFKYYKDIYNEHLKDIAAFRQIINKDM